MNSFYSSFDQWPAIMNAQQLSQAMGLSKGGTYNLMNSKGFPVLKIGRRLLVPKDKLIEYIEKNIQK